MNRAALVFFLLFAIAIVFLSVSPFTFGRPRSGNIMSTATDLPQGLAKAPYQEATVLTSKYELDGVEDGSSDVSQQQQLGPGYTRNDQKDMQRMGKNQELMVNNTLARGPRSC